MPDQGETADCRILSLRGNVNTRLAKLNAGEYDAIILAAAGEEAGPGRAHYRDFASRSQPAIGQGAIGIECRIDDRASNALLQTLHDPQTSICVSAERAMNARLQGGCQVPIAGFARLHGGRLHLTGLVGSPDGQQMLRAEGSGSPEQAEQIGQHVAEKLLQGGADRILQELFH